MVCFVIYAPLKLCLITLDHFNAPSQASLEAEKSHTLSWESNDWFAFDVLLWKFCLGTSATDFIFLPKHWQHVSQTSLSAWAQQHKHYLHHVQASQKAYLGDASTISTTKCRHTLVVASFCTLPTTQSSFRINRGSLIRPSSGFLTAKEKLALRCVN